MSTITQKQFEILQWNEECFPGSTLEGKANHCVKECKELADALYNWILFKLDGWEQNALEEFADVFILMSAWAGLQGYSLEDAIDNKMAENRKRKWGVADKHGVIEHVKETA